MEQVSTTANEQASPTKRAAVGRRDPRYLSTERPSLEVDGRVISDIKLTGVAYGPELGTAPVVIVVGGITASAFPFGASSGPAEDDGATTSSSGWWSALAARDLIDLERYTVLCPSWPGSGSTWAGFGADGTGLSVLGLADLLAAWLEGIGCSVPVTFVGASVGGMVGVVFASRHPALCARVVTISAGLRPDGWGTATRHLQRELVRDGRRRGDVETGMSRARQLGMLTYRGRDEIDTRFGKLLPGLERPPVAAYLDHHGRRFAREFPVETFLLLSEAIDRCQLGESQREVRTALERIRADVVIVGVPGDMLFPWGLQVELHRELQAVGATSSLWKLDSEYGHDAFLADQAKLADLLREARVFEAPPALPLARPRFEGVGREPVREIRLGMIGCGTVGTGLIELVARQRDALADRYRVAFRFTRIAVRDLDKARTPLAAGIALTGRPLELVNDPEVDVLVEVAGGPAMEAILRAALAAGKPVVTANKLVLASKLADLSVLATRTETPLYCEAAAAAAIPVIRHLSHRADEVEGFSAILNGTCNYVITRMEQDELTLAQALARAQELGYAEADPRADVEGEDAAAKLSILAYRAFGVWHRPGAFPVRGITELEPADFDLAEAMGFRIRSIARAERRGDALDLAVEPALLPSWHLLASVEEEYNAVYLRCRSSGDLSLFGKGAGALPTATAVLGDLIDLAQGNSVGWPTPEAVPLAPAAAILRRRYLRVSAEPHVGLGRRIETQLRRLGVEVQSRASRADGAAEHLGFLTSPCAQERIEQTRPSLSSLGRVQKVVTLPVAE